MVYDREVGSMKTLLASPLPRWYLLAARLLGIVISIIPLVFLFLLIARMWDVVPPALGYAAAVPAVLVSGLMLGALGLWISSLIRQLENFASVMNFVIFPLFFVSSALYPLWRLEEATPALGWIASVNPFSHAVELIRFSLYLQFNLPAAAVVIASLVTFFALAVIGYDPGRGFWGRRETGS
jgi:ABC-2 type transport system permease protein